MSRSYKKHVIYKWKDRTEKRLARRAFRHFKGEISSKAKQFYRRVYNSYRLWDNWWWDFDNDKSIERFREILKELEANALDKHLTEDEAYELLDELKELRFCHRDKFK